jgi:hypothetical protein
MRRPCQIHEKVFDGRPAPDASAILFDQSHIPELAARGSGGFLSGHAARNQLLDLLFKMLPNLFRELAVDPSTRKQLFDPLHDSPTANTCLKVFRLDLSFVPQRDYRIDAHRTPRGNVARSERHKREEESNKRESSRVTGFDSVQHR